MAESVNWCYFVCLWAGSGGLPEAMIPVVKAQLLAFLIYTTPPMLQQQLQGVGQGSGQPEDAIEEEQKEADLAQMLPGPCPVLRRLVAFDPGETMHSVPCQKSHLGLLLCANQMPHITAQFRCLTLQHNSNMLCIHLPIPSTITSRLVHSASQLLTTSTRSGEGQDHRPAFKQHVHFVLGVGAVLAVLQQSLGGWEALETDLLESANLTHQAAELSSRVRSATQVVVDAVLDLLDAGVFRYLTCCCSCVHCWHIPASALNPKSSHLKRSKGI